MPPFIRKYFYTYILSNIPIYVNTYLWYYGIKEDRNMAKQKFTTTIDTELLEKIKIQAIKEKRSVSDLLEELIKKYLEGKAAD